MIFSELYSVYYNTVAKIIEAAFEPGVTESDLRHCVADSAFTESVLTILPALKSGKWPLLREDLSPALLRKPTMPLTMLEKRWLKAISEDPRIKLFGVEFPALDDVEPLFTADDYKVYDRYADGDPFEDENYIRNFRLLMTAIKNSRPVKVRMTNRAGNIVGLQILPIGLEYSEKDDKIRIIATGCKFRQINLGRIISCDCCDSFNNRYGSSKREKIKNLTLEITDERHSLERALMHFAHFEKRAERLEGDKYILHLNYYENDETELVIRVLSFGPYIKVLEPQSFVNLIKDRLLLQKSCELR